MSNKRWKQIERDVGDIVGGRRVPLSGANNRFAAGDVDHPFLFIEVKHGAQIPKTVTSWYDKTRADEKKDHYNSQAEARRTGGAPRAQKMPLLVMHPKGSKLLYAMMELNDLNKLLEGYMYAKST